MNESVGLIDILADEKNFIPYRPRIAKAIKGVTAAILFQQILYRWHSKHCEFYKFKEPCDHSLYRNGDSWTEELGFTAEEFDSARGKIAHQQTAKNRDAGFGGKMIKYRVDQNRVTWYDVDQNAVEKFLCTVFENRLSPDRKTGKAGIAKPGKPVLENRESRFTIYGTENTTENTKENNREEENAPALDLSSARYVNGKSKAASTEKKEEQKTKQEQELTGMGLIRKIYDDRLSPIYFEKVKGYLPALIARDAAPLVDILEREVDGQTTEHRADVIVGAFTAFCSDQYWKQSGWPFRSFVSQIGKYTVLASKKTAIRPTHTHGVAICDDPNCTRTDEDDGLGDD